MFIDLLGCFTLAQFVAVDTRALQGASCCWGCLLGHFGSCSCLVMYGRPSTLRHPWGRAGAIPSSPKALP